ncbi:MAG: biotin--[acetyl-CoA-carboxylase] ligase [Silvibacterium sp.]|nr:biotin--[acetyl-CoA-carboxylase] ligase [Silvibacterium sp.]
MGDTDLETTIDVAALNVALAGTRFAGKVRFFESIGSTNTHAMAEGEAGAPDGMVYVADEQTSGRGRGAHGWTSPPGSGLYVSVLLRPKIVPADALWLSLAAGLAVHDAVERVTSLKADLRWPNDLLLGPRKFCGILSEMNAEVTRIRHMVIGIGINVLQREFPQELKDVATSLYIETEREWPRQELLAALLGGLDREVNALTAANGMEPATASILERLERASSWIRGKRVYVEEPNGYAGVTEGLDARGFLLIRTPEGLRTVYSGGVREQR